MNITGKRVRMNWGGAFFDKGDILIGAEEGATIYGGNGDGADADGFYWARGGKLDLVCIGWPEGHAPNGDKETFTVLED